jgi:hypothetical protein
LGFFTRIVNWFRRIFRIGNENQDQPDTMPEKIGARVKTVGASVGAGAREVIDRFKKWRAKRQGKKV